MMKTIILSNINIQRSYDMLLGETNEGLRPEISSPERESGGEEEKEDEEERPRALHTGTGPDPGNR